MTTLEPQSWRCRGVLLITLLAGPALAAPMQAAANIPQIPFQELSLRDALVDPFTAPAPVTVRATGADEDPGQGRHFALALLTAEVASGRVLRQAPTGDRASGPCTTTIDSMRN